MLDPGLQGHHPVRRRLAERVAAGKLPGALLLAGPEAVGKRRVALELAQRELCFRRSACGACAGCAPFKEDPLPVELPNLLRIAPEGKAGLIKVGAVRGDDLVEGGVIAWVHQAALPGTHRWILVEDAHRLNGASANMLLKTLEEPPPGAHFLLVTHRPDAVLQTIRSRAERLVLGPLSEAEAWSVAEATGWEASRKEAWSALAAGTLRYLDPAAFDRASAQLEAWLEVAEGRAFAEAAGPLLPDKDSGLAQSVQVGGALELLLRILAEAGRLAAGRPGGLGPWSRRVGALGLEAARIKGVQESVHRSQRHLARNPFAESLLRETALRLRG